MVRHQCSIRPLEVRAIAAFIQSRHLRASFLRAPRVVYLESFPGIVGIIQATEAIKLIIGQGEPLIGRLLLFDALKMKFRELKLRRNPACPLCGDNPTIKELIDYDQFCGVTPQRG